MQLKQLKIIIMGICACFILIACDRGTDQKDNQKQEKVDLTKFKRRKLPDSILTIGKDTIIARPASKKLRNAYFGDLHVHTTYSFLVHIVRII